MIILRRNRVQTPDIDLDTGLAVTVRVLEAAYAAPVPDLVFDPSAEALPARARASRGRWKPAVAIAAVILAATGAFALPLLRGDGPEPVSAQEILARALAGPAADRAYHEIYVTTTTVTSLSGSGAPVSSMQSQRVEVWYQDAEHVRMDFRGVDASGSVGGLLGTWIRNGDDIWYFFEDGGTDNGPPLLRVMHGSIRSSMGALFSGDIFRLPSDVASALEKGWSTCASPSLRGESKVAGRAAYVLDVCGESVWIDKSAYVVLRAESAAVSSTPQPPPQRCGPGGARRCTAVASSAGSWGAEVVEFEPDAVIPDAVFDFRPPAGTIVSEQPDVGER